MDEVDDEDEADDEDDEDEEDEEDGGRGTIDQGMSRACCTRTTASPYAWCLSTAASERCGGDDAAPCLVAKMERGDVPRFESKLVSSFWGADPPAASESVDPTICLTRPSWISMHGRNPTEGAPAVTDTPAVRVARTRARFRAPRPTWLDVLCRCVIDDSCIIPTSLREKERKREKENEERRGGGIQI